MSRSTVQFRVVAIVSAVLAIGSTTRAQLVGVDLYTMNAPGGVTAPFPTYQNTTDSAQSVGWGIVGGNTSGIYWKSDGTPVNLNPTGAGYVSSIVTGIGGGQQVGAGSGPVTGSNPSNNPGYNNHALLWTGTASSAVDLHPTGLTGFTESKAYGTDGVHQVGYGINNSANHALLWSGTAASAVDLQPQFSGYNMSTAFSVSGNQQVGEMYTSLPGVHPQQAMLWSGTAASAINLDPVQLENGLGASYGSIAYGIGGGQQVGYAGVNGSGTHAMLWTGTAASAVDLNPSGSTYTVAYATNGATQAGFIQVAGQFGPIPHAMVWHGTAASAVDLNSLLPSPIVDSTATSVDSAGDVFGFAGDSLGNYHAVAWLVSPHAASSPVPSGSNQTVTVAGRSSSSGDVKVSFSFDGGGTFSNTNGITTVSTLSSQTGPFNFALMTGLVQTWDLSFTGTFTGPATLTFHFDPANVPAGTDLSTLTIAHFTGGQWVALPGTVDPVADTITVSANSFSPFALVPEPSSLAAIGLGAMVLLTRSRRRV